MVENRRFERGIQGPGQGVDAASTGAFPPGPSQRAHICPYRGSARDGTGQRTDWGRCQGASPATKRRQFQPINPSQVSRSPNVRIPAKGV
jgi:hypothetical protein